MGPSQIGELRPQGACPRDLLNFGHDSRDISQANQRSPQAQAPHFSVCLCPFPANYHPKVQTSLSQKAEPELVQVNTILRKASKQGIQTFMSEKQKKLNLAHLNPMWPQRASRQQGKGRGGPRCIDWGELTKVRLQGPYPVQILVLLPHR